MTALNADRNTPTRKSDLLERPAAAAKRYYAGALLALDANGRLVPGATATTLKGVGRCEGFVDNAAGADDAVTVKVRRGSFRWNNSTAGDAITAADIGADCYIVDDQTVAKTNGTNTRSVAGKIMDVDAQGVWVRSGL
ncbi:hypothetical protein [Bosea sp. TND4EK4]|uniref:hypothetical protein n=1 Tax=Bosea sp. TND4EK4 TaxID=1907408 RepID=UPI0009567075|nr:hypothetical protein [Bosea sp. TND4EK4]SIP96031.1 hypothetical protein SAMN05880592_101337 [Bosea sp. TND4EK4]